MQGENSEYYAHLAKTKAELKKLKVSLGTINLKTASKHSVHKYVNQMKQKQFKQIDTTEQKYASHMSNNIQRIINQTKTIQPVKEKIANSLSARTLNTVQSAKGLGAITERTPKLIDIKESTASTISMKKKPIVDEWGLKKLSNFESKKNLCLEKLKASHKSYIKLNDIKLKEMLHNAIKEGEKTNLASATTRDLDTKRTLEAHKSVGNFVTPRIEKDSIKKIEDFRIKKNQKVLPKEIRNNPFGNQPVLDHNYLDQGIQKLLQRGFIPKDVDLKPALDRDNPIMCTNRLEPFNESIIQTNRYLAGHDYNDQSYFQLDITMDIQRNFSVTKERNINHLPINDFNDILTPDLEKRLTGKGFYRNKYINGEEEDFLQVDRNLTYTSSGGSTIQKHKFFENSPKSNKGYESCIFQTSVGIISEPRTLNKNHLKLRTATEIRLEIKNKVLLNIVGAKVDKSTNEYIKFRQMNYTLWGDVLDAIEHIEKVINKQCISSGKLVGSQVIKLSRLQRNPTKEEVFDCLDNKNIILRYKNTHSEEFADQRLVRMTVKIQSFLRRCIATTYMSYIKAMNKKIIVIQRAFRLAATFRKTKKQIFSINAKIHENFLVQNELFKHTWEKIDKRNNKIVEIHINSLGYDDFKKWSVLNYNNRPNFQISRIFRLMDPNIEQIYISPEEIQLDILAYYIKILEVSGARDPANRLYILYPENSHFFKRNKLSLSAQVLYSPKLINQIQQITENKVSYIVNGFPSFNDEKMSIKLQSPIQTGVPSFNRIFSQKFSVKSLFQRLKVKTLVSSSFIKTKKEFFKEMLNLMIECTDSKRWMIKLNDEFNGRGLATLNTEQFAIDQENLKEISKQDSDTNTAFRDFKESIKHQFPSYVTPLCPMLFKSYTEYFDNMNVFGAVIEEMPSKIFKSIAAVFYISPSCNFEFQTSYEKILQERTSMGYLCPQQIIEEELLIEQSLPVIEDLINHGVYGYITIDFLIFKAKKNPAQRVCFSGIKCYFDEFLAGYTQFKVIIQDSSKMKYFLHIPCIENLSLNRDVIDSYTTFFESCKVNGINYDVAKKIGSVFLPYNLIETSIIGVQIVDDDYTSVIKTAMRTLTHVGSLMTFDFSTESDARLNLISLEKCLDKLGKLQKVTNVGRINESRF